MIYIYYESDNNMEYVSEMWDDKFLITEEMLLVSKVS